MKYIFHKADTSIHFTLEKNKRLSIISCGIRSHSSILFNYSINDITQQYLGNSVVDLGIHFDLSLHFQTYIETVTFKSLQFLGFIERILTESKLSSSPKTLCYCFIQSVLKIAMIIWDPRIFYYGSCQPERVLRKF